MLVFDKVYTLFHFNVKDHKFIHSEKCLMRKKNGEEKAQRIQRTRLLKVQQSSTLSLCNAIMSMNSKP
jgi:hypothetical protein